MAHVLSQIGAVFLYYGKAFKFFRRWWLWKYNLIALFSIIPIALAVSALVFYIVGNWAWAWVDQMQVSPQAEKICASIIQQSQKYFLTPEAQQQVENAPKLKPHVQLFSILVVLSIFLLVFWLQSLVNRPLYVRISCRVEKFLLGKTAIVEPPSYWHSLWNSFKYHFKRIPLYIGIFIFLVLILGIPYVGDVVALLLAAYAAAVSYINFGLERRKINPKFKSKRLRKNIILVLLFGALAIVLLWVCSIQIYMLPLLNLFVEPILVIVGTMLAIRKIDIKKVSAS